MSDDKLLPTGSERAAYLARKMGELAEATRKAADLLPLVPISGEVVAAAGIYATANLLDEVRAALAGSGEREALADLVAALDRCTTEINAAFTFQYIHGQRYEGPTYVRELLRAREVLASAPPEAENKKPARTEVYDGVRGLFVDADAVPDVVMCNGARFVPDLPESIGAPPEASEEPQNV